MAESVDYDNLPEDQKSEALSELKAEATILGINFPANAGVSKMLQLINEHKEKLKKENTETEKIVAEVTGQPNARTIESIQDEALKLIRVRVTVNNPVKQSMEGQFITAGNDAIGTVTKFIPFQPGFYENGYHIPQIILDVMRSMEHTRFPKKKDKFGATLDDYDKARMVKDFTIEILPQLTQAELDELAEQQSTTRSLEDD